MVPSKVDEQRAERDIIFWSDKEDTGGGRKDGSLITNAGPKGSIYNFKQGCSAVGAASQ